MLFDWLIFESNFYSLKKNFMKKIKSKNKLIASLQHCKNCHEKWLAYARDICEGGFVSSLRLIFFNSLSRENLFYISFFSTQLFDYFNHKVAFHKKINIYKPMSDRLENFNDSFTYFSYFFVFIISINFSKKYEYNSLQKWAIRTYVSGHEFRSFWKWNFFKHFFRFFIKAS